MFVNIAGSLVQGMLAIVVKMSSRENEKRRFVMKNKRTYPTWDLWTLTPDKEKDLHFTVDANVSCSDERDVGLTDCEVTVDIDTSTVWVEPVEGYDTEQLKEYVIDLLEGDKASDFEQEIYEQAYEEEESAYYDKCEYEAEVLREEGRK